MFFIRLDEAPHCLRWGVSGPRDGGRALCGPRSLPSPLFWATQYPRKVEKVVSVGSLVLPTFYLGEHYRGPGGRTR